MRTRDIFLTGLGVHLPDIVSVESAVEQGLYEAEEASRTGLLGAAVAGAVPAPELALAATKQALARSGQDPAGLDLLLYVDVYHSGPDGWCPQSYLQRHAVGGDLLAAGLRQGCNGVFGALELAASYLRAGPERGAALIAAADNLGSPLLDRWHCSPGFIMGDAGSAVILSRQPGFARLLSVNSVAIPELEEVHRGTEPLYPPGATVGRPLDFGARQRQFATGGAPRDAGINMIKTQAELIATTLDEAGIELSDVTRVLFSHGSREVVEDRMMAPLGLPLSLSTWEFGRRVGHLGASDQMSSLDHLLTAGDLAVGDHLLLAGLGPGVGIAAAVIEIVEQPSWLR
jgi:3-oxoacyl-[acyl-carrier-protein] synthase III